MHRRANVKRTVRLKHPFQRLPGHARNAYRLRMFGGQPTSIDYRGAVRARCAVENGDVRNPALLEGVCDAQADQSAADDQDVFHARDDTRGHVRWLGERQS